MKQFNNIERIFFLGIGGIGMSALARFFHAHGLSVEGYDRLRNRNTEELENMGVHVFFQDDVKYIQKVPDLVVYTPAVPKEMNLFRHFFEQKIPIKKRAEILGQISKEMFTIAVAGTHGKTTITSMIAHIFDHAGVKISAFIGGISKNFRSNLVFNQSSEVLIVEADEFDQSFLTLYPDIAIISAIDEDHLDIYKNHENLKDSFLSFIRQIQKNGKLIIQNELLPSEHFDAETIRYDANRESDCFVSKKSIIEGGYDFDVLMKYATLKNMRLNYPGMHNLENSLAAVAVAVIFGLDAKSIKEGLASYMGVYRRFDVRYKSETIVFIDDYAHHPAEIKQLVASVRAFYPGRKITGIFQPHLFSRTRDFETDFAKELAAMDNLILMDIYPAREKPIPGITSAKLMEKIQMKNKHLLKRAEIIPFLKTNDFDVLLTIGAGDIDQVADEISDFLFQKKKDSI